MRSKQLNCFLYLFTSIFLLPSISRGQSVLIKHANIITITDGSVRYDEDLKIINGKIVLLQKNIPNPGRRLKEYNAAGKFVCPGLVDMHVHLFSENDLLAYLSHGVTTVLNMDGSPNHLRWRNAANNGAVAGPRVFTAGTTTDGVPTLNWMFWGLETPAQARRAIKFQKQQGYDYIKVYGTLNPDVFDALQQEATLQKITVVGHVPRQVGIATALTKNYKLIAHGEDLIQSWFNAAPTDGGIDSLAQLLKSLNATVTPNLCLHGRAISEVTNLRALLTEKENDNVNPAMYSQWIKANNRSLGQYNLEDYKKYLDQIYQANIKLTAAMHKYKVKMVAGTDAGTNGYPGALLLDELRELHGAGLSNLEVLQTATINAGDFFKESYREPVHIGQAAAGFSADLLVLDKNPLDNLDNLSQVAGVIARGRVYTSADLKSLRKSKFGYYRAAKKQVDIIDSLFEAKKTAEALRMLDAATRVFKTPLFSQWVLGVKAARIEKDNLPGAVAIMRRSIALYPGQFASYNEMARYFLTAGMLDSAKKYTDISLQKAPGNAVGIDLHFKTLANAEAFNPLLQGSYLVEKLNKGNNVVDSVYLTVRTDNTAKKYAAEYKKAAAAYNPLPVIGKGNSIWFNIPGNYGDAEYFIMTDKNQLKGKWKSAFGNNGFLRVTRVRK